MEIADGTIRISRTMQYHEQIDITNDEISKGQVFTKEKMSNDKVTSYLESRKLSISPSNSR